MAWQIGRRLMQRRQSAREVLLASWAATIARVLPNHSWRVALNFSFAGTRYRISCDVVQRFRLKFFRMSIIRLPFSSIADRKLPISNRDIYRWSGQ
jgi:hypothetical protein